jgi:hypothetical protein
MGQRSDGKCAIMTHIEESNWQERQLSQIYPPPVLYGGEENFTHADPFLLFCCFW